MARANLASPTDIVKTVRARERETIEKCLDTINNMAIIIITSIIRSRTKAFFFDL